MKVRFLETNQGDCCLPTNFTILPNTLEVLVINELCIPKLYEISNINLPVSLKYLFINHIEIQHGVKEDDEMKTIEIILDILKVPFNCRVHILRYYSTDNPRRRNYVEYYDGEKSILAYQKHDFYTLLTELKDKYCNNDYFCVNPDFIRKLYYINEKYLTDE
jgi:hypothetical protein